MSAVVVFGTGSFAEVVDFYLTHDSPHEVVAFTAHEEYVEEYRLAGRPLVPYGRLPEEYPPSEVQMFVAVGYRDVNRIRAEVFEETRADGYAHVSYVSSECTVWSDLEVGANCFILEDNTVQPFASIGDDVILWSGNHVGHHSEIGEHCFVSSHVVISGHVRLGAYSFLGVNATLRDGIELGASTVVGAGALVMQSAGEKAVFIADATPPAEVTSDRLDL